MLLCVLGDLSVMTALIDSHAHPILRWVQPPARDGRKVSKAPYLFPGSLLAAPPCVVSILQSKITRPVRGPLHSDLSVSGFKAKVTQVALLLRVPGC